MKNIKLLKKVISKDCKIASYYYKRGQTCAVGALAIAAGVPVDVLKEGSQKVINGNYDSTIEMRNAIHKKFGLSCGQLEVIQSQNDHFENSKDRRSAILERIEMWEGYEK